MLMAEFIGEYKGTYESVFDIGTGTGILSIVASKCNAKKIWAIDIDEISVLKAKENFFKNNVNVELAQTSDFECFDKVETFDMVIANILTKDLLHFKDKLISYVKEGKHLLISGIHKDNYDYLIEYFNSLEIEYQKTKTRDNWYAVSYKKIGS